MADLVSTNFCAMIDASHIARSTIADEPVEEGRSMTRLEPVHPGEILKHDFMYPLGLSAAALAREIGVSPGWVRGIVRGDRGITAEMALRLARYFGADARSWMNLQSGYELAVAERTSAAGLRVIQPRQAA